MPSSIFAPHGDYLCSKHKVFEETAGLFPHSLDTFVDGESTQHQERKKIKEESRLVRDPYQTCPEMLSLRRTQTEKLKWTSKREKAMVRSSQKEDVRGSF